MARTSFTRPVIRVFWEHMRRYRGVFLLSVCFSFATHVIDVITPLFYKIFFDALARSRGVASDATQQELLGVLAIIAGLYAMGWAFRRVSQFSMIYIQPRVMSELMETSFAYLIRHSYNFFVHNFTGSLVRRITRISRAFEQVLDRMLFDFIPIVVTIGGILIVLFSRHMLLGAVFSFWMVLLISIQFGVARWKHKYNLALAEKDSETTGALSDSITNDITVKLFSGEEHEDMRFGSVAHELQKLRSRVWGIDEWINTIQGALAVFIEIALFYVAIMLWRRGVVTIGDFALLQAYIISAVGRLWGFGNILRKTYEAFADAAEMVDILDMPHEVVDKPHATALTVTNGRIVFRSVEFSFQKTRRVLKDFNLTVAGGEKVALVGPSGAGKSTVVKLLFRLYDIDSGSIEIDGLNIAHVTQRSLREAISLVPQEPILFHRSLRENIRYGRRDATDEEIVEAAKKAHCHEFMSAFPEGYDTLVGERGVRLSGGEKQRVAIARAILKNAPILVLDEATSSLDSESEALIQDALHTLMEGKTVMVIAHRLSTIMKMDRIVVIEQGAVTVSGTHDELLNMDDSMYKKLWDIQAGGFLAAGDNF